MVPYKDLFLSLAESGVRYLIAGGFAMNLHQVQRATVDIDLIIDMEQKNAAKFIETIGKLGYVPGIPVQPDELLDGQKREKWINEKNMIVFSFVNHENPYEVVDVFIKEFKQFHDLDKNKINVKAYGIELPVIGVEDLIELKRKAGRDKDLYDIKQLMKKINGQ